jgi:hypothetical protein
VKDVGFSAHGASFDLQDAGFNLAGCSVTFARCRAQCARCNVQGTHQSGLPGHNTERSPLEPSVTDLHTSSLNDASDVQRSTGSRFGIGALDSEVKFRRFRVKGEGCRVWGLKFGVYGLGSRVQGLGARVQGLGSRV